MEKCAYSDHTSIKCSTEIALFTAYTARGCRRVCAAHAAWLETCSVNIGYGSRCPDKQVSLRGTRR